MVVDEKPLRPIAEINFGYCKVAGHAWRYENGISVVPGENGVPISKPHPWNKVAYRELRRADAQHDMRLGDVVRVTLVDRENGRAVIDREGRETYFTVVGFVAGISNNNLFLASGNKGLPSHYPRNDIKEWEIWE